MQDRDEDEYWSKEPNNLRSDPKSWPEEPNSLRSDSTICSKFQYHCFESDDLSHGAKKPISTESSNLDDFIGSNRKAQSIQVSPLQLYLQRIQDGYKDQEPENHRGKKRINSIDYGDEEYRNKVDYAARRLHAERDIQLSRQQQKQELLEKIQKAKFQTIRRKKLRQIKLILERMKTIKIADGSKAAPNQTLSVATDHQKVTEEAHRSSADSSQLLAKDTATGDNVDCSDAQPGSQSDLSMVDDILGEGGPVDMDEPSSIIEDSTLKDFESLGTDSESEESSSNEGSCEDMDENVPENQSIPIPLSVNAAVDLLNRALVERTMAAFWVMYDRSWTAQVTSHAGTEHNTYSSSGSTSNSTTMKLNGNNFSSKTNKKRSRDSDDGSTSDGDENGSEYPRSNPRKRQADGNQVKLACPFRKHDPAKFNLHDYPICALSSWSTISRVKEHLSRVHQAPIYCERCKLQFKTAQALKSHLTVPDEKFCKLQDGPVPDGIGPELAVRLKSRKKSSSTQSPEERWKDIFRILFPDELVPMPYFEPVLDNIIASADNAQILSFEEFYRRELPRTFRHHLDHGISENFKTLDDHFKAELVNIVKDCHVQIASKYQSSHGKFGHEPPLVEFERETFQTQPQDHGNVSKLFSDSEIELDRPSGKAQDSIAGLASAFDHDQVPTVAVSQAFSSRESMAISNSKNCFCVDHCSCPSDIISPYDMKFQDLDMVTIPLGIGPGDDIVDINWWGRFLDFNSSIA